ncbi:MAG: hypothetical protein ACWGMZ_12290, partial [Thermoguttaceae bacterium]
VLRAWHEAGAAAGDVAFWRKHVEQFQTAKSYASVVDTLLDHGDLVAARALLVNWLSREDDIPLVEENYSFNDSAVAWMDDLWRTASADVNQPPRQAFTPVQRWSESRRFLDYLEANAGDYWQVPRLEFFSSDVAAEDDDQGDSADDVENLYSAAYEQFSYRDTTDDGMGSSLFETGRESTEYELVFEAERIVERLSFLSTIAHLWETTALASLAIKDIEPQRDEILGAWQRQCLANYAQLMELLDAVHRYRIPPPQGTHESMVNYDRRRGLKEMLLENIINACVDTADTGRMIRAAMNTSEALENAESWEEAVNRTLRATMRGDRADISKHFKKLLSVLRAQPLLYVALARGGNPRLIVAARGLQCMLCRLLAYLPRLGLLAESLQLLETIQGMEYAHPQGPGAITEFDRLFQVGCKAIVRCLVVSAEDWAEPRDAAARRFAEDELIAMLEESVEAMLRCWLAHSRGARLSVLETVHNDQQWEKLQTFIQKYGSDLFTQQFLNLGNLRAILMAGVDVFITNLYELPEDEAPLRLLADLDDSLSRRDASHWLGLIIEAVVENYPEYVDYNSITTQSDRGDMLYTLLDFLRLRAQYDRIAWNLRPILLTHDVLVRGGRIQTAAIWSKAVSKRT